MADTGIFCTTADVQRKAGASASTTSNTETYINQFVGEAESLINCTTRFNWSDVYSGLNTDLKYILRDCASCLAAMMVIQYDMSGYQSRQAETMLDVLRDRAEKCLKLLEDQKTKVFIYGS